MEPDEAIVLIREFLQASDQKAVQKLIAIHLPRMDATFFSVLAQAAESESARGSAVAPQLESLAGVLLPLRTLI
jgi:hypothetical protein